MQDVTHHDYVCFRQRIGEETSRLKTNAIGETVLLDILLKDRRDLGQVEADAREMRILERYLHD